MYNINLATPQEFTQSLANDLYFQSWKSSNPGPINFFHFAGDPTPAAVNFDVVIENHFATELAGKYSAFKATAIMYDFSSNLNFQMDAGLMSSDPAGLTLTPNNLNQPVSVSLKNLSLTSPGSFKGIIVFQVNGIRADSGLTDYRLSIFRVYCNLNVLSNNSVSADTDKMVLSHIKTELPLPAQQFEILSGVDFHIFVPEYFELSGGNLVPVVNNFNTRNKYFGNGRQTVSISVKQEFDFYPNRVYVEHIGIQLIENFTAPKWQTELVAYLLDVHEIISSKEALEFFSIKGVRDDVEQTLEITSSQDYTVTHPFFLQASPLDGSSYNVHSVKPIAANNLVAGDYQGVILFESADASLEVPVSLKVVESIDAAFNPNTLNFTDDTEDFTNIYSNSLDDRASLNLSITSYDHKGFPSLSAHPFKLAFFNSKVGIHLGEIIARRFYKLKELSEIGYRHYDLDNESPQLFEILKYGKPTELDIQLDIERRRDLSIKETKVVNDIKYIKGRKPMAFQNDYGILKYEPVPIRVTRKSQMIFNFVRKLLDHDIIIKRNDVTYKTVTHSPGYNLLFGMRMFFTDFNPGDVIDIKLVKNANEYFVQQYFVFPDQNNSYHLAYQTEHNVLETFECTGGLRFNTGYENITSITYAKLVEYLENLDSSKEQSLVINTGWILKSNQIIVDAIIRSKRVWFLNKNKEISLTPITKKIVNEDSEQELYEYELEFKINLENDSEVYTS